MKRAGCITTIGTKRVPCYCKAAINRFGLTNNYEDTAWIMPDGNMLDFSKGSYEPREHADIQEIVPGETLSLLEAETKFMKECDAIRFSVWGSVYFETIQRPTIEQIATLQTIIRERNQIRTGGKPDEGIVAIRSTDKITPGECHRPELCFHERKNNYGSRDVLNFVWKCWE